MYILIIIKYCFTLKLFNQIYYYNSNTNKYFFFYNNNT